MIIAVANWQKTIEFTASTQAQADVGVLLGSFIFSIRVHAFVRGCSRQVIDYVMIIEKGYNSLVCITCRRYIIALYCAVKDGRKRLFFSFRFCF